MDPSSDWFNGHPTHLETLFPVHYAASKGDISTLSSLLKRAEPADLNGEDDFFGWTPTHWAAYFGQVS